MTLHSLEPFIILPYRKKQDILFYSGQPIKQYAELLVNDVYADIPNTIVRDNLIKVAVRSNYIIIFHIYPTDFKEMCSGRGGQNLIIGYVIHKKELITNFGITISEIKKFFEAIKICAHGYHVPTRFLQHVNYGKEVGIKESLDRCINEMNNVLSENYSCFHFIENRNKIYNLYAWRRKRYREIQIDSGDRLESVYKYIVKHSAYSNEYWILVNCRDISYYNFRNICSINFIENGT